jgi:electron transport complex protein RnfC
MKRKTFSLGGIHPSEHKLTSQQPIVELELPRRVSLLLSQHIGAPAEPVVAVGDVVERGRQVAAGKGYVSAGINTPISGTVKAIGDVLLPSGYPSKAIVIEATEEQHEADETARKAISDLLTRPASRNLSETLTAEEIRNAVARAGVVGLGGATFPSVVKLSTKPDTPPEFLIINACECEPYLTCDDALMRAYSGRIIEGVELMLKASGAKRAIIGIEDNKLRAYKALMQSLNNQWPISVCRLKTKYPQGGEKQLIEALTGRRVPSGALPAAVGAIVNNVATAFAVYQAVALNLPLMERVITISGDVDVVGNYLVAIGTSVADILPKLPEHCKVIFGGPMMGRTAVNLDTPITKGTSGIVVLKNPRELEVQPCIRCATCVNSCPMGLEPYLLSTYGRKGMWDEAEEARVMDCIECGSCSYVCPSARPLLDYIRIAKNKVGANIRARKSKK